MWKGIGVVKPGAHLGDIGHAIQTFAESNGFSVVREYCGHGIGRVYHEDPQVLHYGKPGTGLELVAGMTFTIEPMINAGRRDVRLLERRLDGGDQGPVALGAMGTHHPGHRRWVRSAHARRRSGAVAGRGGFLNAGAKFLDHNADWAYLALVPEALKTGQYSPAVFRQVLDGGADLLRERFQADEPVEALVRDRALLVDLALRAAWVQACGPLRGRSRPGGGRRLRARRTAPELRHRHHGAAAEERFGRLAIRYRALPDVPLGHRPRSGPQRALHR